MRDTPPTRTPYPGRRDPSRGCGGVKRHWRSWGCHQVFVRYIQELKDAKVHLLQCEVRGECFLRFDGQGGVVRGIGYQRMQGIEYVGNARTGRDQACRMLTEVSSRRRRLRA